MAYAENLMLQGPGYIFSIAFCMEHDACAFGMRRHVLYTLDCNTVLVCMFPRQTVAPLEGWQKGRLFIFIPKICVSTRSFSADFAWCEQWCVVLSYGIRIVILWHSIREDKNLWLTKGVPGTNTIQKLQFTVYEIIWAGNCRLFPIALILQLNGISKNSVKVFSLNNNWICMLSSSVSVWALVGEKKTVDKD